MTTGPAPWQDVAARLRPFIALRVPSSEIDDVLQDVFIRMQRGLPQLRDEERFTSWLFQIARNSVADHMRVHARHPLAGDDVQDEPVEPATDDDRGAARELAGCVTMFVAQLPSPYREAITLVELEAVPRRRPRRWSGSRSRA